MPEILEINIKAKRELPPSTPTLQNEDSVGAIVPEFGKKYRTKGGDIVEIKGSTVSNMVQGWYELEERYWWIFSNGPHAGCWQGEQLNPHYHRHLAREWFSKVHDAWLDGKIVEIKGYHPQALWYPLASFVHKKQIYKSLFNDWETRLDKWQHELFLNAEINFRIKP